MLVALVLLLYVATCVELQPGDLIQVIRLTANSTTALSMSNQYGKIVGTQQDTDQSIRYQVQLLAKDVSGALKAENLRRVGRITIHSELGSSEPRKTFVPEDKTIGIPQCPETLHEYNQEANIPLNVFGFESAGGKLHELMQFLRMTSNQTNSAKEDNAYLVGAVLSVNKRILSLALHQKYPKSSKIYNVILRLHADLIADINYDDCTRYGTDANFSQRSFSQPNTMRKLECAYCLMYKSYGWEVENWKTLLYDVVGVLRHEFTCEYYGQELRPRCLDDFVNYTLNGVERFNDGFYESGFPAYPGPFWPFVALQDLLSSGRIIRRYWPEQSKDIDIRVSPPHVQSLKWFLKRRMNDLGYEYVDEIVKEGSIDCDSASARRFQQKMTRFIGEYITG